jgi:aryl-alcohol dehydrogenase-like predicted oxidoreductase
VEALSEIAGEKGVKPGQLALAWLLHKGKDIVPIPGTRRIQYLEENVASMEIALSEDDMMRIDAIAPAGSAAGERGSERQISLLDR